MKKHLKHMVISICIGLVMSITAVNMIPMTHTVVEASSKKKVVKVTSKVNIKGSDGRTTLYGKAEDGSVVWKYNSAYCPMAELNCNEYYVNNNLIFLFSDKLYAISKSTGKVKWTHDCTLTGTATAFDKKGNMYFTGTGPDSYSDTLCCISPKGKLIFKTKHPDDYARPYAIKLSTKKIRVYIEYGPEEISGDVYLTFDRKGKFRGVNK